MRFGQRLRRLGAPLLVVAGAAILGAGAGGLGRVDAALQAAAAPAQDHQRQREHRVSDRWHHDHHDEF
jgi:hypothetical protein